jgi:hypothetical protein
MAIAFLGYFRLLPICLRDIFSDWSSHFVRINRCILSSLDMLDFADAGVQADFITGLSSVPGELPTE